MRNWQATFVLAPLALVLLTGAQRGGVERPPSAEANQPPSPSGDRSSPSSQEISVPADQRREEALSAQGTRPGVRRLPYSPYSIRSYDGTENNRIHPEWGSTYSHLVRLGEAAYADGVSAMAGPLRPSAREVSNAIAAQPAGVSLPNSFGATDFVWQWGQFLDHDITLSDGAHEEVDIAVPYGDQWFDTGHTGTQTISFHRALYDPQTGHSANSPREQENEITAWIDGSMVYGSSDERAGVLRASPRSPYLKTSAGDLLPYNHRLMPNANGFVPHPAGLFLAGDVRANEQIGLTVMHTLFMREHNRIVTELMADNSNLRPEDTFQHARMLVIGEIQHITYTEFLPALLGEDALSPYDGYNRRLKPGIYNEFASAAYRLGHSMVNAELLRLDAAGDPIPEGHLSLRESFFTAPSVLKEEGDLDPILRGLAAQAHQQLDTKIVDDLRNFLFGAPGAGGFDLASLNIQRGRDHGLPSYNHMRAAMGLPKVTSFAEITSDPALQDALYHTYGTVNDIDLWVGGLAEDPMAGSQLGPLFHHIVVHQFTHLRDADRFWYEWSLSPEDLAYVKSRRLSDIIRDNTGIGAELQDDVFHLPAE